jgi:hypothetical protein
MFFPPSKRSKNQPFIHALRDVAGFLLLSLKTTSQILAPFRSSARGASVPCYCDPGSRRLAGTSQ